jgi:hypothetical protein
MIAPTSLTKKWLTTLAKNISTITVEGQKYEKKKNKEFTNVYPD